MPAQLTTQVISNRSYNLYKPELISPSAPVYIHLHGFMGHPVTAQAQLNIDDFADDHGFMVAYPQGTPIADLTPNMGCWNAGNASGKAVIDNVNDVGFLTQVINDLILNHGVDPLRVYIGGHSNGALMAIRYIGERPWKIAGLMTIAGVKTTTGYFSSAINRPWLHIHGHKDELVPVGGGLTLDSGFVMPSLSDTIMDLTSRGLSLTLHLPTEAGHSIASLNTALHPLTVQQLIAEHIK